MTKDEKQEIIQRLDTACKKTKQIFEKEPISSDFHLGTDIAQRWVFIIAAYSGIEQSIKFLIADETSKSIESLLQYDSQFRTHDLNQLFCQLSESTKTQLSDHYYKFQSLHNYITVSNLDEFLKEVSGEKCEGIKKGIGYERWRYTLIEYKKQLPRNCAEALVAIWEFCVEIAEARLYEIQELRMIDDKLRQQFYDLLFESIDNVSIERQQKGHKYTNPSSEINEFLFCGRDPLNVYAELIRHYDKFGSHGVTNLSDQLSEILNQFICLVNKNSQGGLSSFFYFVERSRGRTRGGESIRWNCEKGGFEDVPWSLESNRMRVLPDKAVKLSLGFSTNSLQELRLAAKESNYELRENRAFSDFDSAKSKYWHCTLQVFDGCSAKAVVSIWEKNEKFSKEFQFVEECPRFEMSQSVRRWVELKSHSLQFKISDEENGEFEN